MITQQTHHAYLVLISRQTLGFAGALYLCMERILDTWKYMYLCTDALPVFELKSTRRQSFYCHNDTHTLLNDFLYTNRLYCSLLLTLRALGFDYRHITHSCSPMFLPKSLSHLR